MMATSVHTRIGGTLILKSARVSNGRLRPTYLQTLRSINRKQYKKLRQGGHVLQRLWTAIPSSASSDDLGILEPGSSYITKIFSGI